MSGKSKEDLNAPGPGMYEINSSSNVKSFKMEGK
jgi:hypothetical protein